MGLNYFGNYSDGNYSDDNDIAKIRILRNKMTDDGIQKPVNIQGNSVGGVFSLTSALSGDTYQLSSDKMRIAKSLQNYNLARINMDGNILDPDIDVTDLDLNIGLYKRVKTAIDRGNPKLCLLLITLDLQLVMIVVEIL
jgi:hypothetical protein